jgi:dUTP pyrophosphatase
MSFRRLYPNATPPFRKNSDDAGWDLHFAGSENLILDPGCRRLVATGLSITSPPGTYGRIAPRSGLALNHGLDVLAGVVDPGYTGEVKVCLINFSATSYVISPGSRIAQIIFEKIEIVDQLVDATEETAVETTRGADGFGSSGV